MPVPTIATTQDYLPVYDIQDSLVVLKNGAAAMVIEVSAVNFGLLSDKEQDAIIYAYAALLNSLNFTVQILIRSQRKDISAYLELLSEAAKKHILPTKKLWINSYRAFVAETVQRRNVLDKKFYLILPFSALELGSLSSLGQAMVLAAPGKAAPAKLPAPLGEILKKAAMSLLPKRDHLIKQLERIGLTTHQLTNQELLSLLYRTYNPGAMAPPVTADQMTGPLVQPMVKNGDVNKSTNETSSQSTGK